MSTVNRQPDRARSVVTWQDAQVSFGDRLREARKGRGLTGSELGDRTGIDNSTISRWERGQRAPGGSFVTKLARELGVTERWLMSGEGPREPGPVAIETPVGPSALEAVLFAYDWPEDVPISTVDEIESLVRAEAQREAGRKRSASAWRLRLVQMLRERDGKPRSRPRVITGGSK